MATCKFNKCSKKFTPRGRQEYCNKSCKDKAYRLRQQQKKRDDLRRKRKTINIKQPQILLKKWGVKPGDLWYIQGVKPNQHHRLFCGDWLAPGNLDIILQRQLINLVVTDPPYIFGLSSTEESRSKLGPGDLMNAAYFYAHCYQIIRDNLHLDGAFWTFHSRRMVRIVDNAADIIGWPYTSSLVWNKVYIRPGGVRGLRSCYEMVTLFTNKNFRIPNRSLPDVWNEPWSTTKPHHHQAEKPVTLFEKIIIESNTGPLVFDPFCGSGTTLEACHLTGRNGYAAEFDPKWVAVSLERMQNLGLHPEKITP